MVFILYTILAVTILWIIFQFIRIVTLTNRAIQLGKKAKIVTQDKGNTSNNLLIIGDSTAVGTGADCPECSLVGRLAQDFPENQIINAAKNAMDLKDLEKLLNPFQTNQYNYLMIHIGGMDTLTLLPLKIIRKRAVSSLRLARKIANKEVFLVSVYNVGTAPIFQFPLNIFFSRRSRLISQTLNDVCNELSIQHIPLYTPKEDDPLYKDVNRYFSTDGLHPNSEGYGLWYSKIRPTILSQIIKNK